MSDITGTINSKKFGATGITEQLARQMRDNLGGHYMGIVELKVNAVHEDADGNYKVDLTLEQVEPSTSSDLNDHLRELTRTLHYNRKVTQNGPTLPIDGDGPEPTVDEVVKAGAQHRPHPFLPDDAANDNPICDVCGKTEPAPVHSTQQILDDPDIDDDDQDPEDHQDGDDENEAELEQPTPIRPTVPDPFSVA